MWVFRLTSFELAALIFGIVLGATALGVFLGRGVLAVALASLLVSFLLLVIADLDRPTRGMIRVPDTALRNQLGSMQPPPAAGPAPLSWRGSGPGRCGESHRRPRPKACDSPRRELRRRLAP
jgi:hypothetical protein